MDVLDRVAEAMILTNEESTIVILREAYFEIQQLRRARDEYLSGWSKERQRVFKLASAMILDD